MRCTARRRGFVLEWTCKWLTDSEQLAKRQVVDRGTSLKLTWKNNQTSRWRTCKNLPTLFCDLKWGLKLSIINTKIQVNFSHYFLQGVCVCVQSLCESCNGEVEIGIWHFKEKNATFTFYWLCSIPFAKS